MRKRYFRRSTFITGHGRPLTRITSPHSPEWSSSVNRSEPSLLNSASDRINGTSYRSCGIGNARSTASNMWYCREQPVIGVLGGVMDAVVVVPQRSSRLEVRVVVVLELARVGDVARVAVELRQRRRAVQVHRRPRLVAERRVDIGQRVDVSHDRLAALVDLDRRARHRAVVGEEHRLEPRHDLDRRGPHRDAVVVGRGILPYRLGDRRNRELGRERHRELARRHPVVERGLARHDLGQWQRQRCAGEQPDLDEISAAQRGIRVVLHDRHLAPRPGRRHR